jgi:hypothetical protein
MVMADSADSPHPEDSSVMLRISVSPSIFVLMWLLTGVGRADPAPPDPASYFAVEVVDDQSGRGVPMVELRTTYGTSYVTDSAGLVAFFEPGLMGKRVFFDRDQGRMIYLEGSYVNTFSGNPHATPYYEYNQIMYRLDLADRRLKLTGSN